MLLSDLDGGSRFLCAPNLTLNSVLWKVLFVGEAVGETDDSAWMSDAGADGVNEEALVIFAMLRLLLLLPYELGRVE